MEFQPRHKGKHHLSVHPGSHQGLIASFPTPAVLPRRSPSRMSRSLVASKHTRFSRVQQMDRSTVWVINCTGNSYRSLAIADTWECGGQALEACLRLTNNFADPSTGSLLEPNFVWLPTGTNTMRAQRLLKRSYTHAHLCSGQQYASGAT
ncbi:hypothetical protein N657DRAFT_143027 [Parathielavia appendiculata]|uniref:Uncharacterized protein n=1 Tax=Parathielavia appendiculata TaxID=2587402 RepID=A0AAN6TU75_9PEZI|nr:hypothetical protein N657DRAFT_143027 [Parathielavia appendiculata]